MANSIIGFLEQIAEATNHIVNILPAIKDQIEKVAFETHSENNCCIGRCPTYEFLEKFIQKQQIFLDKCIKDLSYFENLKCSHNQTNNLNYYNKNRNFSTSSSSKFVPNKQNQTLQNQPIKKVETTNEQTSSIIKSIITDQIIAVEQQTPTVLQGMFIDIPCNSKQAELNEETLNKKEVELVKQVDFNDLDQSKNESKLISDPNVMCNETDRVYDWYQDDDIDDGNRTDYLGFNDQLQGDENSSLINLNDEINTKPSPISICEYVQTENMNNNKLKPDVNLVKESGKEINLNINNELKLDLTVNIVKEKEENSLNCTYNNNMNNKNNTNNTTTTTTNNNNNNSNNNKKTPVEKIKKDELNSATGRQSSNSSSAGKMSSGLLSTNIKTGQLLKYIILDPSSRRYDCWTTHVESPFLVWVQLQTRHTLYKELYSKINKFYDKFEAVEHNSSLNKKKYEIMPEKLKLGIYVAAISQIDNKWYRGRIVKIDERTKLVTIFFIDFGNCEELPLLSMRLLIEKFLKKYPAFAIPLSIANACPLDKTGWPSDTNEKLCNFLNNRECVFQTQRAKNSKWPIWFGKFTSVKLDIDNKAIDFDLLNHFIRGLDFGVPLACANTVEYIAKNFRNLMEPAENYYKLSNYVDADAFEEINDLNKNKMLSLINEGPNETDSRQNLINKPVSVVTITEVEVLVPQTHEEKVNEYKTKEVLTRSKSELKENVTIYCGKKFINNFEQYTRLSELKLNELLLDQEKSFQFKITEIRDPYKFYVNCCAYDYTQYSNMFDELNEFYGKNEAYFCQLAKELDYNFARHNLLCVAKSQQNLGLALNNHFHRACLKKIVDIDFEDYEHLDESKTKMRKVIVLFIDYGITEELDITDLLPIAKEFCEKPPGCISCKLYGIEPAENDNLSQISEENIWSLDAIFNFKNLFKKNFKYKAILQNVQPNAKISCEYDNPIEILIYIPQNDRIVTASDALVECGLARYNFINNTNENKDNYETASQCARNNDVYSNQILHKISDYIGIQDDDDVEHFRKLRTFDWVDETYEVYSKRQEEKHKKSSLENLKTQNENKNVEVKTHQKLDFNNNIITSSKKSELKNEIDDYMKKHYDSIKNNYSHNQDSMEAHRFGYEIKPPENSCSNFWYYKKCFRDRCPHFHVTADDPIPSKISKKQSVFFELTQSVKTFEKGDMLLLKIFSFKPPKSIEASILGYYDINLKKFVIANNYTEITDTMNKYYGKKRFLPEKTAHYEEKQIVAVKEPSKGNWSRARILRVHQFDDIEMNKVEVFYVDLCYSDIVSMKDIYPIKKEFLKYPSQYIQFELSNIVIEEVSEFKIYLHEASNETKYFYAIVHKKSEEEENSLEVFLSYLFENKVTSINDELISLGYASPSE